MKTIYQIIVLLLIFSTFCFAGQKVFTQTVKYVMGENESRQDLRELATLEAKRLVLEEVGVYLEAETNLTQYIKESEAAFHEETGYSKNILAITAGVTRTEITAEVWSEENAALCFI